MLAAPNAHSTIHGAPHLSSDEGDVSHQEHTKALGARVMHRFECNPFDPLAHGRNENPHRTKTEKRHLSTRRESHPTMRTYVR